MTGFLGVTGKVDKAEVIEVLRSKAEELESRDDVVVAVSVDVNDQHQARTTRRHSWTMSVTTMVEAD